MALIYEKPASSSESLLSMGSDDPEANLPTPEPLGSSKALSPAPFHKWWWRKKPVIQSAAATPNSRSPPKPGMTKSTSFSREKYQAFSGFSAFLCDARAGLIVVLFVVLAITTLITVQFRDSEIILALFTALALLSLALLYYYNCCASPNPWWSRKTKNGSGDLSPLVLPSTSNAEVVSVEKPPAIHVKPSPHRRDWSLPTMPSIGILSHRRSAVLSASPQISGGTPVNGSSSGGFFKSSTPQLARIEERLVKHRVEYSLETPVESRIEHIAGALHSIASATGKDAVWSCEARLAEALTWSLTSCMSQTQLTQLKQAIDRELRRASANDRYCTLYGALFDFLQKGERDAILTHFSAVHRVAAENKDVEAQVESTKPSSRKRLLISDIDDTLVPTFKDRRGFAWGVPYPGVRQLYKELIAEVSADEEEDDEAAILRERLAFVTARPSILRSWTKQELAKAGFEGSIILMGYASTATTPQGMLAQKVKQVRELKSLWPEFSVILVGDNGQRDIDLGAILLKEKLVEAVFIHDIFASKEEVTRTMSTSLGDELDSKMPAPLEHTNSSDSYLNEEDDQVADLNEDDRLASIKAKPMVRLVSAPAALGSSHQANFKLPPLQSTLTPVQEKKRLMVLEPSIPVGWRHDECVEAGIDLFQTYAGAALRCYQKGLLKVDALERVARRCASDLGATSCDGLVKQQLVDSLLRDVARVALEFKDKAPLEKVAFLEFVHEAIKNGNSA